MKVFISDIAIKDRQRRSMDPAKLKELALDIATTGLLHPPVVRPPNPGEDIGAAKYVLMAGGRRTAAHIMLGRAEIEVNLKADLDPIQARIAELSENIYREDLTWEDEVAARAEIAELLKKQNPDMNIRELAEEIGVSHPQLSRDLNLHKMMKEDPTLRQAASKGAALRNASFKHEINQRVAAVAQGPGDEIRKKLFTADASQFIRTIKSKSIDLVFPDLPYAIDYFETLKDGSEASKGFYDDSPEKVKDFIADVVPHCMRVVKPGGWVVFFMCYEWHDWLQTLIRTCCAVHFGYKEALRVDRDGTVIWSEDCNQGGHPDTCKFPWKPELPPWIFTRRGKGNHGHWPELHASNRYEMLVVTNGGQAKLTKKPTENVLDYLPLEGPRLHAMQKPHDLCREIIERTTVIGETVLDICFGSGAHMAAAASLGRDFLGCDRNPDNLNAAISLVSQFYNKESAAALARGKLKLED